MASRFSLAECLSELEHYDEAIELRRVDLAWSQREYGEDDPGSLLSQQSLGLDLLNASQNENGLTCLLDCLKRQQQVLGPCEDSTIATAARVMDPLSRLDRPEEAIALSQAVQKQLEDKLGSNHPEVLIQLSNQARMQIRLERWAEAEQLWRRCLQGHEQRLDSDEDRLLTFLGGLALVLALQDRHAEAEPLYRRGLSGFEASRGRVHPDTLQMVFGLAEMLTALERHSEAIPLRRRELTWCRSNNEPDDPGTFWSVQKLAADLFAVGELEEAEALMREALAGFQRLLDPSEAIIGELLSAIASQCDERGNRVEAIAFGERAIQHLQQHEGSESSYIHAECLDQAQRLISSNREAQAIPLLNAVQNGLEAKINADEDDLDLLQKAREKRRLMNEQ